MSIVRYVAGLVAVAAACGVMSARAASITVEDVPTEDGRNLKVIVVEGELTDGDGRKFAQRALSADDAIVIFDSPGGKLAAGIEIGKAIRLMDFGTLVPDGASCESACALAWLAGNPPFMEEGGRVGFHAAWEAGTDGAVSSLGNALVGAYLTNLGLPPAVVAYATTAQPKGMRYLTLADAQAIGMPVRPFDQEPAPTTAHIPDGKPQREPRTAVPGGPPASEPPAITVHPAVGQEWIQMYSRRTLDEARALATAQQPLLPGPASVFGYTNGWFVVALGPYRPGQAAPTRERLAASGLIPQDSLVTTGANFVSLTLTGDSGPTDPATPEASAVAAVEEIFRLWSQPNAAALAALPSILSETVVYFGKPITRGQFIREKATFAERWPERMYRVQQGSTQATCTPSGSCVVRGVVGWNAYSPARNVTSVGTASFRYVLSSVAPIAVAAEESEVLTRNIVTGRTGERPLDAALRGYPETFRVTDIAVGDTLKIRAGAGSSNPVVAGMPLGAVGVAVTGCRFVRGYSSKWCQVAWSGYVGWASACCLAGEKTGRRPD